MKIVILTLALVTFGMLQAQVAVGKKTIEGSGLLDFPSGTPNGILLPIVETLPSSVNGTIVMDKNDLKVKMFENDSWKDLSAAGSISGITFNTGSEVGNGVIIGAESSTVTGVLVLESSDKSLILPKTSDPHLTVKSPRAGHVCYDTVSKTVAIFDGVNWNYWK